MIRIKVTEDYAPLITFFIENDLEFEEGEEYGDDEILKCWRADSNTEVQDRAIGSAEASGFKAAADAETTINSDITSDSDIAMNSDITINSDIVIASDTAMASEIRITDLDGADSPFNILVGGCILAKREGEYICDGIAVTEELRASGLGRIMLDLLISEVRKMGGKAIYLVARAPGFFAKSGFVPVERADAPDFFECFTCPQYGKTCHPEVMRLDV